jgi:eukaryotic-like serine/threonine-protein kinase
MGDGTTLAASRDAQIVTLFMNPDRWQQVKDLLGQALDIPREERSAFLDGACDSDNELRAEIDSLLSEQEVLASNFLGGRSFSDDSEENGGFSESMGQLAAGQVFASRFLLVHKLGQGGMGQVWLAEQTDPVRRQVALKLIKAGMYDESAVRRFQAERQSLAMMDHPAIAKVFDAGTTPQGQPYFVMEYVPGFPITEYCDQRKLKIADRLELFIQACEGVQHAHQKAIIHRDLKPANILVVDVDGRPVPRIIDFGLAKAITPQAEGESLFTQIGQLIGTPGYMSPEQANPDEKDIDTRTDVYSLGAVLYVLLAGSQPFAGKAGERLPLDELIRKLRNEEPPSPSARVSSDRRTMEPAADARGTEPKQLVSLLRGDLDWITMKALEKDRDRRYGTPAELAADIERYLNHEPVVARSAGASYRLRKYVRRHRATVAIALGLALLLAAFSIVQAVQLRRITRERDRAARITDFMTGMFKVSDPSQARGNSVTAREILDKASSDITTGLSKDPEVQTQMMQVMATTYLNLGLYPRARDLAQQALDARKKILPPDDPRVLQSMAQLGWIIDRDGHYADAERLERRVLERERRVLGNQDPLTIESIDHLSVILEDQDENVEAEKLAREAIDASTGRFGAESAQTLLSMNHLARALFYQARYAEAEQEYRELTDVDRRVLGPDHPQTLAAMSSIGATLFAERRFAEAEQIDRQVLAIQRRVLGENHQATALTLSNLASNVREQGRLQEAEKLHREALAIRMKILGPEHAETLTTETNLADVLFGEGRSQEAEKLQRDAIAVQTRVFGPDYRDTVWSQSNLAGILIREGHYAEAEALARKVYEAEVRTLGPDHDQTVDTLRNLGEALAFEHRYPEAVNLFRDGIKRDDQSGKQGNRWQNWYALACVATAANRADDAIQYLNEAIRRGYSDADGLMGEFDLNALHQNPRFVALVEQLRHSSASRP